MSLIICDDVSGQHGEITGLEDSKATPEKVVYQPFAKKQPKYPKYPNFGYL